MCQQKEVGGLGLRKMDGMNRAFIMKLAWGVFQNSKSLWVRVLRSKYFKEQELIPYPQAKQRDSVLWKGICKVWPFVTQGVNWALGCGNKVLFWKDSWLEGYGPLNMHTNQIIPEDLINCTVADMVDNRGQWQWETFAHLLPIQVLMILAGYNPPTPQLGGDKAYWRHSPGGQFSVKSAYLIQEDSTVSQQQFDPLWHIIWKWKGLERVKIFLWTVAHGAIMTNKVRWRRKITANPCCYHCLTETESIIHALRDCPKARGVWDRIIEVADREAFYSLNWYTWLLNNLRDNHPSSKRKFWGLEFGIALWQIWKERNHRIFNSTVSPYTNTVRVIRRLVEDIIHSMAGESGFTVNSKQRVFIGWRYPPIDWVKVNVDGCSKGNPGVAGAGGVIRDAMGKWIVGFAINIGICTSVGAELWAIANGLQLAWSKGFRKIILESDSSLAVDLITNDKVIIDKNYNLIMQARYFLAKDWDIQVIHVYREANSAQIG